VIAQLEQAKPIERAIAASESHDYQLTLDAGQYARVAIFQRRINVAVSLFDPQGKKVTEEDWFSIGDSELVSMIAETKTTYRIEVRAPDKAGTKGSYEIKLKELQPATEREKNIVAGDRLMAEGMLLIRQPDQDSWRKAIEKYQQSIQHWQGAAEPAWEASALYLIGYTYIALRDKQKAFDYLNQAIQVAEAAAQQGDEEHRQLGVKTQVMALSYMGQAYYQFGDPKQALKMFSQALLFARKIGDHAREIDMLNYLAYTHQAMGEFREALDYLSQEPEIVSEVGDRYKEASFLSNMCVVKDDLGEYKQGIDFCNQALSLKRDMKDRAGEAVVLNNLGSAYSGLGEYQQALDSYTDSYAITKVNGTPRDRGIALSNIGWAYGTLGDYEKALGIYNEALEIFRAEKDRLREGNVLGNIAVNYADQKDFRKSLEINLKVLELRREAKNKAGEAVTLNNIGGCYQNLGDNQAARGYYERAIALHRESGNQKELASSLGNLGSVYRDLGDYQKALEYLNEALKITRTIGDRYGEAGKLQLIAGVERDRGNLDEAKSLIEAALAAVESVRINLKSQRLRASYFAFVRKYHELDIELLMRLNQLRPSGGFDAAALQATEKGRARSLLELITEAGAEIRKGVDPALVERERILRQTISDKADRQTRLLSGKHTDEQATSAAKELDALTTEYEQVQTQIRQKSPQYAALTQPVPLSLPEIQSLLDGDSLLIEYALGEKQSFLWVVTPTTIKSFELPKRADIEAAARRVYDLITASYRLVPNTGPAQKQKRLDQADSDYPAAAVALSAMLLGPISGELKNKRLLIVGEGVLQYVPFAALPEPQSAISGSQSLARVVPAQPPTEGSTPLIANHEIVSLPSASVLGVLRQEALLRKPAAKTVAVFADPVFDTQDARIAMARRSPTTEEKELAQRSEVRTSAAESGLNGFARLRFSRQEADQIMKLAPSSQSLEALDFAATRAGAIKADLGEYRIVHFATHGLINNQHAELSGIVLSLVDEQGQSQNGFLRIYDIYNLNLKADLVVLSACQTALGKDVQSEGLVGLTRAFMYAGATRVVASLWQADDRGTATLMSRFYEGMLAQRQSPAAALRNAQLSMWKDKRWQHPRYWAAFTLQGDWK